MCLKMVDERVNKYLEVEKMKAHIKATQDELNRIATTVEELEITKEFLDNMSAIEDNTEVLIPLGSGVYVMAEITRSDRVYINAGGVVGKQGLKAGINFLEKQLKTLNEAKDKLETQITALVDKLQKTRLEIEASLKK